MAEKKYLKVWQYFTFGSGNAGMVLSNNFITAFFILFITTCYLDLNVGLIGTLMLIAKIFDGISDLIFGNIMDHGHSKLGKARPWMLRGAIPLGLFGILMFFIPNVGGWVPYAYFFVFYLLYNAVAYTVVNLSYNAMTALITRSDTERVQINMISYLLVLICNLLINALTLGLVKALGNTVGAWRTAMTIFTAIGTAMILISAGTVKELPPDDTLAAGEGDVHEDLPFKEGFKLVLKNPYFIWCIIFYLVNTMVLTANSGLTLYFCEVNLGNIDLYSGLSVVVILACIPGLFVAPLLVKKFGTYKCNLLMSIIMFVCILLQIPFALSKNVNMVVFTIVMSLRFLPFGVLCASIAPIVPSVVEYSYKQTGKHLEGLLFSSSSIGYKVASGLSAALPGWILTAIGYVSGAETQSASTVNGMAFSFVGFPAIIGILMIWAFYSLNVEKGLKELEEKQAAVQNEV